MSIEDLQKELKKNQALLEDANAERGFLAKQTGMHIKAAEFDRIDRDLARYTNNVSEIQKLIDSIS